jgi:hypothetical protein
MPGPRAQTATCPALDGQTHFTLEQANRALVYVRRIADDITHCYHRAVGIRERIERPLPGDLLDELKQDYDVAMDRLNDLIEELQQVGVELKDFEQGLIEFPAIHAGREVYLCWRRGESAISQWHEVDAGYGSRRPVSELGWN